MQLAAWCWTTMRIWCKPKQHIFSRQNCKRFVQNQQNFFFSLFLAVMLFLNDEGRRHFPSGMKLQWFTAHESCLALQKSSSFEQWSSWTVLFTWFFFRLSMKPAVCDDALKVILLHVRQLWHIFQSSRPPRQELHATYFMIIGQIANFCEMLAF